MIEDTVEEDSTDVTSSRPQKKLPDYSQLRKDTSLFDLKVQEFFTGSFKYPNAIVENEEKVVKTEVSYW